MAKEYPYEKVHAIFISWRDNNPGFEDSINSVGVTFQDNYIPEYDGDCALKLYLGSKDPASKESSLATLRHLLSCNDPDSMILIYYDGHGKLDKEGKLHLCP